jgi:hypothetical protein
MQEAAMDTPPAARDGDGSQGIIVWQHALPTNWSTAVPISTGNGHYLLVYDTDDGHVLGADIDIGQDEGITVKWQQVICDPPLPSGLTSIMPFSGLPYFLAHKDGDETTTLASVITDDQGISITTRDISGVPGTRAFMPLVYQTAPDDQKHAFLLAYNAAEGKLTVSRIDQAGSGILPQAPIDWGTGWTVFMPFIGDPFFLSYQRDKGTIRVARVSLNDLELSFEYREKDDWDTGWTSLTSLVANGGPTFLAYDNTNSTHIPQIYSMVYDPLTFNFKQYDQWAEGAVSIGAFSDQRFDPEFFLSYQRVNIVAGDPHILLTITASVKPGYPLPEPQP